MKKLYRKGTVHPSPPPPLISDQLSFLPQAVLTLTIALSPEDREVLAYLISCSSNSNTNPRRTHKGDHPPLFHCSCFRCYMSYWVRWDTSPNHQLIHEIIDAFEDWLSHNNKAPKRKDKRNKRASNNKSPQFISSARNTSDESEPLGERESSNSGSVGHDDEDGRGGDGVQEEEKGAVRRFVGFIGERIWGAWGQ